MITNLTPAFRKIAAACTLGLIIVAGCTYDHGEPAAVVPCENATPQLATYRGVVSPIFDRYCRSCHGSANPQGGMISFATHQDINNYDVDILLGCIRHTSGYDAMPKNQDKIPACDIARIEAWVTAGKPNN